MAACLNALDGCDVHGSLLDDGVAGPTSSSRATVAAAGSIRERLAYLPLPTEMPSREEALRALYKSAHHERVDKVCAVAPFDQSRVRILKAEITPMGPRTFANRRCQGLCRRAVHSYAAAR